MSDDVLTFFKKISLSLNLSFDIFYYDVKPGPATNGPQATSVSCRIFFQSANSSASYKVFHLLVEYVTEKNISWS